MARTFFTRLYFTFHSQIFIDIISQLAEHLQAYHNKWLRNVNEKNSISQAITKVKALERRHRNPERSVAAPPALHHQIPAIPYELSGQIAQPPDVFMSDYDPIIVGEHVEAGPSSSTRNTGSHQSPVPAVPAAPSPQPSSLPSETSKKRKGDSSLNDKHPQKCRRRTCQKCGMQECAGGANRKYCKNPCQDCGKIECHGRNSQHPKKPCTVGWGLHHKKLKL